ncbi:MAG: hypothetical protein COS99_07885 [Candidatus Omnitrophica bacterium CG07_land_8_20_14_0_80_42_15]|uniref:Prepilin-type N-terminal cleavage/methylation domain-containing protein n=1 Tax=Candidatus Aquitaenariimonas noxiae TaxID=1974741 RepID=A0A2J0L155_9BACT|nr:MAG: hypothetical protein COS99_07885 [Candidatus Omnitrophica bacterium CG07_land_8_20_14_0_80_42_15]
MPILWKFVQLSIGAIIMERYTIFPCQHSKRGKCKMCRICRLKYSRGFTLIEVLLSVVLTLIVVGFMYQWYIAGWNLWESNDTKVYLQGQTRSAMRLMVMELRNTTRTSTQNPSPNLSIPSTPNNNSIQFYLPIDKDSNGLITDANGQVEWDTSNKIKYDYIPGQHILRRLEGGQQRILAKDVTDVSFSDITIDPALGINEVKITLTVNKTVARNRQLSFTLQTVVRVRN